MVPMAADGRHVRSLADVSENKSKQQPCSNPPSTGGHQTIPIRWETGAELYHEMPQATVSAEQNDSLGPACFYHPDPNRDVKILIPSSGDPGISDHTPPVADFFHCRPKAGNQLSGPGILAANNAFCRTCYRWQVAREALQPRASQNGKTDRLASLVGNAEGVYEFHRGLALRKQMTIQTCHQIIIVNSATAHNYHTG